MAYGQAHILERNYTTLHSGVMGTNTVMEGAPGHSRRVWAIIRASNRAS